MSCRDQADIDDYWSKLSHVPSRSIRAVLARAFELMLTGWFETEETIALGDHVVVLWSYAFDKQDSERGHIRGADIFRVRGVRVAKKLSYVKSEDFVQKLGLEIPSA